ncbi:hypothetical protein [Streptacidiphilus melanogenes]|uniref:hypothetical protein n=1 Tax=Streptacidiphilus melanogenes TaxID=411235 RepID=UPI000693C4D5|nr:hypothetical protein [Streptacidiphilus melanogenes]
MPTITVETNLEDPLLPRRAAKAWSLWMRRNGVDINHVITKFLPLPDDRVFSGPFPLGATPSGPPQPFAFVQCSISETRSPGFRAELAEQIVRALGPDVPDERIFIRFDLVDPALHVTGAAAVRPAEGPGPSAPTDFAERNPR